MRVRIKDATYDLDESRVTVAEAKTFKRHAGMSVAEFRPGLARYDADAMIFLMWLAKSRAGERVDWSSFDDLDLVSDVEVLLDDEPADRDEGDGESDEGGADPTSPGGGKTRTTGSSTTSGRSRSTSGSTRAKSTS